eukprot:15471923-Alexandrium_andersonii.AAC.1
MATTTIIVILFAIVILIATVSLQQRRQQQQERADLTVHIAIAITFVTRSHCSNSSGQHHLMRSTCL